MTDRERIWELRKYLTRCWYAAGDMDVEAERRCGDVRRIVIEARCTPGEPNSGEPTHKENCPCPRCDP